MRLGWRTGNWRIRASINERHAMKPRIVVSLRGLQVSSAGPHLRGAGLTPARRMVSVLLLAAGISVVASQSEAAAIDLGAASGFAVLAGSGIAIGEGGVTTITGDIGSFSTTTISGLGYLVLNGANYGGDETTQHAKLALSAAYATAVGWTPTTTYASAAKDLGGLTLLPGVYRVPASSIGITGTLTLDAAGDTNAYWIFQAGSSLITEAGSRVAVINGAQAMNVYWQVGSSATLGVDSIFTGSILALTSITANNGARVYGRLQAENGAVTLDRNSIYAPVPEPGTLQLLGLGIVTLAWFRLKPAKRQNAKFGECGLNWIAYPPK